MTQEKTNPEKTLEQSTPVELARLLQEQFQQVCAAQQKIIQCQQNIWAINQQLDKIEGDNAKVDTPKPEE